MKLPKGLKLKLDPQDEYCHEPEDAVNYNESMYFNIYDGDQKVGGWFRIGNRVNEHYAEMTTCLYLPDGRIAFTYAKPEITHNKEMNAGGLKIEVVEPFKKLNVTYEGKVLLMDTPHDMAGPAKAFKSHPRVPAKVDLQYRGVSPMYGGETVNEDGSPLVLDSEKSFARAHYEQHMAATGTITVGDETWTISGFGLRDKSWGPRHWQSIYWYRWLPMAFGEDFGMMVSIIGNAEGQVRRSGMVLEDGKYHMITDATIESEWDDKWYQKTLKAWVKTENGKEYNIDGKVISLIPLRNRRKDPDGNQLNTRITEGMTQYTCKDGDGKVRVGYGLSEYLDQIVDGKPVGQDVS